MTTTLALDTKGFTDIIDITDQIQEIVSKQKVKDGLVNIFATGSTAAVTAIEHDPNLYKDLQEVLEKLAPYKKNWKHHQTWNDDNGSAHIRASLIGPSVTLPFIDKKIQHGTWQKIVVIDFDTGQRSRKVLITIISS